MPVLETTLRHAEPADPGVHPVRIAVEELDGEPGHRAVTLLWRGHRATRQVLLERWRLVHDVEPAIAAWASRPGVA